MEEVPEGHFLHASESVGEGHPDKMCDQIGDGILDACLELDPEAKVQVEVATKSDLVCILGELTVKGKPNLEQVARSVVKEIGYD